MTDVTRPIRIFVFDVSICLVALSFFFLLQSWNGGSPHVVVGIIRCVAIDFVSLGLARVRKVQGWIQLRDTFGVLLGRRGSSRFFAQLIVASLHHAIR